MNSMPGLMRKLPGKMLHLLDLPRRQLLRKLRTPRIEVDGLRGAKLIQLGTSYGGWCLVDDESLHGATIVSAGAGEDISFDIAIAARYGAVVHVVDPTPRARLHVEQVMDRIARGLAPSRPMDMRGGKVDVDSYDVSGLAPRQIKLVCYALWNESKKLRFYAPANPAHVSHSIVNLQHQSTFIEVEAVTVPDLLRMLDLRQVALLKLDIEGAEIEVIAHMVAAGIFPRQLLIEYDEMHSPSAGSRQRIAGSIELLRKHGYSLAFFNGTANFLFVRNS